MPRSRRLLCTAVLRGGLATRVAARHFHASIRARQRTRRWSNSSVMVPSAGPLAIARISGSDEKGYLCARNTANTISTLSEGNTAGELTGHEMKQQRPPDRRFSASLWRSLEPPLEKMRAHPFIRGVRDGTIGEASMYFYLQQDFLFLVHYGRTMRILSARMPPSEPASRLLSRVADCLDPVEIEKHAAFDLAGLRWADLKTLEQAPYTRLYTDHLLATACLDSHGSAFVSLLPCPMTYVRLFSDPEPDGSPPRVLCTKPDSTAAKMCHAWVSYYTDPAYEAGVEKWQAAADGLAANVSVIERRAMLREFDLSTRMESLFWDMAWMQLD
eukprot:COSAG01_NODE_3809_length_5675_cov_5.163349_1_plen_328_part_10